MERHAARRWLSLLLCLVMVVSLLPGYALAADPTVVDTGTQVDGDTNDLKLEKALIDNGDGTYSVQMTSYAEGEIKTEEITEKIPTDFVVIVDQSGSMATTDMATGFQSAGTINLEDANTTDYYTKVTDADGREHYYRVYPVRGYMYKYYAANTRWSQNFADESNESLKILQHETRTYTDTANQYYYKTSDGVYRRVTVSFTGKIGTWAMRLRYTDASGNVQYLLRPSKPVYKNALSSGKYEDGDFGYDLINDFVKGLYSNIRDYTYSKYDGLVLKVTTGMYVNHELYKRWLGYTKLCYRDADGVEHTLTSDSGLQEAQFCNDSKQAITTYNGNTRMAYSNLYTSSGTKTTRLTALQNALTEFTTAVAQETDDFGTVDNRIAIVGFSSKNGYYRYNNTEVLTGVTIDTSGSGSSFSEGSYYFPYYGPNYDTATSSRATNYNGPQYYKYSSSDGYTVQATDADYASALVKATTDDAGTVNSNLTQAIKSIGAYGGTQPEDGFVMAKNILQQREDVKYTMQSGDDAGQEVNRNTIVIFFTDGHPGDTSHANMYSEANDVVKAAYDLKHYKNPGESEESPVSVFSIGVFGESDGNPLVYPAHTVTSADSDLEYDDGYVKRETGTSGTTTTYYYMNRYWLYGDVSNYGDTPNDTIFDYMSVVSSNYPNATGFVSDNWATSGEDSSYSNWNGMIAGVRGSDSETNDYYRMASNQDTLVEAFKQAVTMINSKTSTSTSVTLDDTAVLTDVVNTQDFDASAATVTAQVVDYSNTSSVDSTLTSALTVSNTLSADGTVAVKGFDYSAHHKTSTAPRKLIVTISGLTPKKAAGKLTSNDGNANIADKDGEIKAETTSPSVTLSDSNRIVKVVDFGMTVNIDDSVSKMKDTTQPGGTFNLATSGELTFVPSVNVSDASAFSGVNQTMYLKSATWKQAIVIPAASVYISDNLASKSSSFDDGVSGYDANVVNATAEAVADKTTRTITFTGTGIDVYAVTTDTTSSNAAGWISANIYGEDGKTAANAQIVKNNSLEDHYGVPTIRFTVPYGTYTVKINTIANSDYRFEGIRIYQPGDAEVTALYADVMPTETAPFTRVRDLLLSAETFNSAVVNGETVGGAIFTEMLDENNVEKEQTTIDAKTYAENGPKGEVYLRTNQAIAFNVGTTDTVLVGMSSADGTETEATVTNGTGVFPRQITKTVDMYYEVTPDPNGYVCIKNTGDGLLAITNVRVPNASGASGLSVSQDVLNYLAQFEALLQGGADQQPDQPERPDQPQPPKTLEQLKAIWSDSAVSAPKLISALWQSMLKSFASLFAGLAKW